MNLLIIDFEMLNSNPITEWYAGCNCYLITSKQSHIALDKETIAAFKMIVAVDSINSENDDLIFYHAEKMREKVTFDYVIGVREFDLLPAAIIRANWSLPGANIKSIEAYRDKGIMKEIIKENGLTIPSFKVINNSLDVINFIKDYGYPVILKPRTSKRARGITLLENDEDLYNVLRNGLKETAEDLINMMIEEFITGPMYHIDGMVIDNEIKFIWPSLYVSNCMGFQKGDYISSCLLSQDDELFNSLIKYVEDCIHALPSPINFAFHAEVFVCSDGTLKLCEIAARAGGGPVMTSIQNVFGINPKEIAFKAYINSSPLIEHETITNAPDFVCGWIIIPNKHSHSYIFNIPETCPFHQVTSYKIFSKNGDVFDDERQVVAEISLQAMSSKEITNSISEIMEWFYSQTKWQPCI